ncbi:MAG: hypothetical protein HYV96_01165 [Opitutae bacterium]|nr:hypothetical protein [Opitutae bacterium]
MSSDRLNELRRQRALVQQHLEWLEAEIAAAENKTRPTAPIRAPVTPLAAPAEAAASPIESISLRETPATPDLDALVAAQNSAPANSVAEVKRGCFIAFAALFAVLGLAVYGLYLYSKSRH